MSDILLQHQAEVKVLEFKLNRIRTRLKERIKLVDTITKNELEGILSMINEFETVPPNWQLEEPLVNMEEASND